jgi:hypothetical protein
VSVGRRGVRAIVDLLSLKGRLAAAVAWRWLWAGEDRLRGFVWARDRGFDSRLAPVRVTAPAEPRIVSSRSGPRRLPRSSCLGVVAPPDRPGSTSLLAEAGRFYGLDVFRTTPNRARAMLDCAVRESWPLLGVGLEGTAYMPAGWTDQLHAYVAGGGTLLLHGVTQASGESLDALSRAFDMSLPRGVALTAPAREVLFTATDESFAAEFSGAIVQAFDCQSALTSLPDAETLVWVRAGDQLVPAVSELAVGSGRLIVCAGAHSVSSLSEAMATILAQTALPTLMLVRQVYGEVAWRAPAAFANFVIDDPALRNGTLGLDYRRALAAAREHNFHLTVATIPRELALAEAGVVELLRDNGRWVSACYHGSDHSGYEFFFGEAKGSRYRARPVSAQVRSVHRGVARGELFARRSGIGLDRVMVFPHGVGSPQIFTTLQSVGFIASCNFDDRYPLGAPVPDDFDLGMRPADLGWSGFPLMWRRGLPDRMYLLDLFLGRPAITFGHLKAMGGDVTPFIRRSEEIHALGRPVRWSSLEDISRHSYMQRRDPKHGWQVSMFSNEICLHNETNRPRTFEVERPNLPTGYALIAHGALRLASGGLAITIPPGDSCTVGLASGTSRSLTPGRPCSIAQDGVEQAAMYAAARGTNAQRVSRMEATNH